MAMTRAEYILELSHPPDWGSIAAGTGTLAGIVAAVSAGKHAVNKHLWRQSLRKLGYVNHPTDPHAMVHTKTGRTYRIGWGFPHD